MLDYLIKTNKLEKEFVAAGLIKTPSDTEATFYIDFIKELINPNINEEASTSYEEAWPYPDLRNKSFLFEVIILVLQMKFHITRYRLWPTRETGLMWTNGTTSRETATILELPAALTLTEQWSLSVLLKWMDSDRSASGTRYSNNVHKQDTPLNHAIIVYIGSTEYLSAVPNTSVFVSSSILS